MSIVDTNTNCLRLNLTQELKIDIATGWTKQRAVGGRGNGRPSPIAYSLQLILLLPCPLN
jgi:hypothetical protein